MVRQYCCITPSADPIVTNSSKGLFTTLLIFTFIGTGFIKYQIRNMVGYLIKIGEGKKDVNSIPKVLSNKDRTSASITAHPEGLYLVDVEY